MRCAWNQLLTILPPWIRSQLTEQYPESLQELRLRLHAPPEAVTGSGIHWLEGSVSQKDLDFCINNASRYSPWTAVSSAQGYLTAPGGHRIGICGDAIIRSGDMQGYRSVSSLCIRVARDFPGIARELAAIQGSLLILGAPGWGKTTLLRDLIRLRSNQGSHISVIDERGELFPADFPVGNHTDVLTGCPKRTGIGRMLRVMGPDCIAVDEITQEEDCEALLQAVWCGVTLLATAHAASMDDFLTRRVYKSLRDTRVFDSYVILHQDKSWHLERSKGWITNASARF